MKETAAKKLEVIANISVIAVAALGCILLAKTLLPGERGRSSNLPGTSLPIPEIGTVVSLPEVAWSSHKQTVILVLSTQCRFCADSAPFFRKLAERARERGDTGMIALFPQDPQEGADYLQSLNVPVDQIIQAPIASAGARGTPTLILADEHGSIMKSWVGRVSAEREPELLGWLK